MELDDFKTAWKDSDSSTVYSADELCKLMLKKSHNPLYLLKRRFARGLRILLVMLLVIIIQHSGGSHLLHHVVFWFFTGFALVMFGYFAFSYRLAGRMMAPDQPVKVQLESQFRLLEKIFWWRKLFTRLVPVLFISLLELVTYQTHDLSMQAWAATPLPERLGWYAGACLIFYTITYIAFRFRYARHFEHLKAILEELN